MMGRKKVKLQRNQERMKLPCFQDLPFKNPLTNPLQRRKAIPSRVSKICFLKISWTWTDSRLLVKSDQVRTIIRLDWIAQDLFIPNNLYHQVLARSFKKRSPNLLEPCAVQQELASSLWFLKPCFELQIHCTLKMILKVASQFYITWTDVDESYKSWTSGAINVSQDNFPALSTWN